MTVGCDCEEEMVALGKWEMLRLFDEVKLKSEKFVALVEEVADIPWPGGDAEEPHLSMSAAAEVAEAMVVAEGGSGWLCVPS